MPEKAIATQTLTKDPAYARGGLTGLPPVAVFARLGALFLAAFGSWSCTNRIEVGSYATALAPDGGPPELRNERTCVPAEWEVIRFLRSRFDAKNPGIVTRDTKAERSRTEDSGCYIIATRHLTQGHRGIARYP